MPLTGAMHAHSDGCDAPATGRAHLSCSPGQVSSYSLSGQIFGQGPLVLDTVDEQFRSANTADLHYLAYFAARL